MNSLYHCIFWKSNACKSICMYGECWTFAYTIHWGMKAHLTLLEFYMNSESFFFVLCLKYVWALIMMWNIISNVNNEYILLVWSSPKFEFWISSTIDHRTATMNLPTVEFYSDTFWLNWRWDKPEIWISNAHTLIGLWEAVFGI